MIKPPLFFHLKMMALGFLLLAIPCSRAWSVTTNTSSAGLWNTGGNWDNGIPGGTDDANINHAMIIDGNVASTRGDYTFNSPCIDTTGGGAFNLSVQGTGGNEGIVDINANVTFEGTCSVSSNGTLIIRTGDTLIVGATTFANGSTVNIESGAVLIVNGNLQNNNNSTGITINGNVFVNGNVNGGNGSAITGAGGINATGTITTDPPTGSIFGSTTDCTVPPCAAGPGAVPIELNYFISRSTDDHILLEWETLSESNNNYFILDRSIDGHFFEELAKIPGSGNSQEKNKYSFEDFDVIGGVYYYRLWQTDFDGASSLLGILGQSFKGIENEGPRIFPNPVTSNSFNLNPNSNSFSVETIALINARGGVEIFPQFEVETNSKIRIDLPETLFEGLYVLKALGTNGQVINGKVFLKK